MKRRMMIPLVAAALMLFFGSLDARDAGQITLPRVTGLTMKNGARLFVIRDELPVLTVLVSIGCGSLYEGPDDAGLSSLLARTLSLSGTPSLPGNLLHEKIESMGGRLSVSSSWENIVISLTVLNRFRDEALSLLGELITQPLFAEDTFRTAMGIEVEALRRKNDNPASVAFERARMIIFAGRGYGAVATAEKVSAYNLKQVSELWNRVAVGGNIITAVSSPDSGSVVSDLCNMHFVRWRKGERLDYPVDDSVADRVSSSSGKIYFIEKDIPQATVIVGTVGPPVGNTDIPYLEVMNYILGEGSFNSILMREIRVKKGLAYAVGSVVRPRYRTGVFLAYAATRNQSAGEVLGIMENSIHSMSVESQGAGDLRWARNSLRNSYVFQFDTPASVLAKYIEISYNGLPETHLTEWPSRIGAVRTADVRDAATRLFGNGLVRVVVGGRPARESLEGKGEIVDLPLQP